MIALVFSDPQGRNSLSTASFPFQTGYSLSCCVQKFCLWQNRLFEPHDFFLVPDVNSVRNGLQVVSAVCIKTVNCRKRKNGGFSYPLIPPSGTNFTTEQICCKSMVHHEPWDISRFMRSLPAVCRSCAFSYMPSLSGTHMLNANGKLTDIVVWQREPPCAAVSRFSYRHKVFAHAAKINPDLATFCKKSIYLRNAEQNVLCHLNLRGEPWGGKLCRLKRRGRKASPPQLTSARNAGCGDFESRVINSTVGL